VDVKGLGHDFEIPTAFITNDEQLRQVVEVGLEIVLLDDLWETDRIPE